MTQFDKDKLLPCPFCGNNPRPIMKHERGEKSHRYSIGCPSYCCVSKTDTATKLREQWNTRAVSPQLQSERDLADQLAKCLDYTSQYFRPHARDPAEKKQYEEARELVAAHAAKRKGGASETMESK